MPCQLSSTNKQTVKVSTFTKQVFRLMKESTFISILFATLLYILMRVFFIGSPFSIQEGFELFGKTCFITCCYLNIWNLVCVGIIWLDKKTTKTTITGIFNIRTFKRAAIFIVLAAITYSVKANRKNMLKCDMQKTVVNEPGFDQLPKFYFPVKF